MQIPNKLPGLRWPVIALSLYGVVWISLEGALWQVMVMGVGITAVSVLYLVQRLLGGRRLSVAGWLAITAVLGTATGAASVLMTLAFMAVKTGLHAHGPEFTPTEITWTLAQLPLWSIIGLLVGTAVGFLTAGLTKTEQ